MKLIAEKLGKADKSDRLRFVRADGSETQTAMPRQGTLAHDLVHYVVESALPLQHGFLSLVAAGADAGFVMQMVHDPANHKVETQAIQVEAIVEALQTQLWGGYFDHAAFLEGASTASMARGKAPFDFNGLDPQPVLYDAALALLAQWTQVPYHQSMELRFVAGSAVTGAITES
jgi:hypothetical protein